MLLRQTSIPREVDEEDSKGRQGWAPQEDECVRGAIAVRKLQGREEMERECHGGRGDRKEGMVKRAIANAPRYAEPERAPEELRGRP